MAGLFTNPQAPNVSLFSQNNQPYQPPPQNILPQTSVSDAQRIPLYNELLNSKYGWAQANNNLLQLDEALQNPDLNDNQRKAAENLRTQYERAREGYGNYANFLRDTASNLGVDVSDYGADKTLEQSAQALNNYSAAAVRDLLGTATPRAQAEARYKELRDRGASPAQANRIISREREGMQENYLSRLSNGITTYGLNPDGSLNDLGIMLAQRMAPNNPQVSMALFGNAYATPKDVFNARNQVGLLDQRLAQQAELAQARLAAQRQNLLDTFYNQFRLAEYNQGQQNARSDADNRTRINIADANNQTRINIEQAKEYLNSPEGKFAGWYALGKNLFGDERQAQAWAIQQIAKPSPKDADNEKLQAAANLFGNRYRDIETALRDGDDNLALARIEEMKSMLREKNDYAELLDMGSYTTALKILDAYTKVAKKEYKTLNEALVEIEELKSGAKMTPDQIMAYFMNTGEFGQDDRKRIRTPSNTNPNINPYWYPGSRAEERAMQR